MSFLEKLKNAANSPLSSYIRFLQQYKKDDKSLHLFYEGDDDPSFYTKCITDLIGDEYRLFFYNCKNKGGVYSNHSKIDWRTFKKARAIFFVDKDHSDILGVKYVKSVNIFVTKYYSIENYLVTEYILERILRELIAIDREPLINELKKKFRIQHKRYSNFMLLITSWIIHHRQLKSSLNLNNINLNHLFCFDENLEVQRITKPLSKKVLAYLDEKAKVKTAQNSWKTILSIYRRLVVIRDHKIHLRGKFEVWFLIAFVNAFLNQINSEKKKGEQKYKLKVQITVSNAIAVLGYRIPIPNDLEQFFKTLFSELQKA